MSTSFVDVNVKIAGKTKTLKMERGTSFENNGGIYAVNDRGVLLFSKDNTKSWQQVSEIKMTAYQNAVFNAFANNDGKAGLSKKDILLASQMAKKGTLAADASVGLADGYKIDSAKYFGAGVGAQVHVKHDKNKSSQATLNFKVGVLSSVKPQAKSKTHGNTEKSFWGKVKDHAKEGWNYLTGGSDTKKTNSAPKSEPTKKAINPVDVNPPKAEETSQATVSNDRYNDLESLRYDAVSHSYEKDGFDAYNLANVLNPIGVEHGFTPAQEAFNKSISAQYDGKPVTPKLVNEVFSKALDAKAFDNESLSAAILNHLEDLTPKTIDKFLRKADYIHVAEGKFNCASDVNKMKKMYSRLNEQQKNIYYQKLLKVDSITGTWATTGDEMNVNLADYIFEKPVSATTYNKLKALIANVNTPGNDISSSKTVTKDTIDTLLQRGQITKAQANELYKSARLSK